MSDRIQEIFRKTKERGVAAFVSYVAAGDPDFETSLEICRQLVAKGTDILELGVPFSDPLADGLTNQLAAERALAAGSSPEKVYEAVSILRREFPDLPIVLYTYYNLLFSTGLEANVQKIAAAGADAVLTLDLPPEESQDLLDMCDRCGLGTVYIVAPTTPPSRMPLICSAATSFIYYVSQEGVTGERKDLAIDMGDQVEKLREHTDLPIVVGFGISQPEHVRAVGSIADGVVVGSALVRRIAELAHNPRETPTAVGEQLAFLRKGLE